MSRAAEGALDRGDEVFEEKHEPCVDGRGQGPARGVEAAGEFVSAGHGFSREIPDDFPGPVLVVGILYAEVTGNREGRNTLAVLSGRGSHSGLVEFGLLGPFHGMAAREKHDRIVAESLAEATPFEGVGGIAEEEEAYPAALAFHDGVGREGGGEGNHPDVGTVFCRELGDDLGYAPPEVPPPREGLGRGKDAAVFVEDNAVGEGAAGIDSQ